MIKFVGVDKGSVVNFDYVKQNGEARKVEGFLVEDTDDKRTCLIGYNPEGEIRRYVKKQISNMTVED